MPVYVIDPSRPVPPKYGDLENAFELYEGDTLVLAEGAELVAYGRWAWGIWGHDFNNTLLINGRVHSEHGYGIVLHGTIIIGATGTVHGGEDGIYTGPDPDSSRPSVLTNAGTIEAVLYGITLGGGYSIINNSGQIVGGAGIQDESWSEFGSLVLNNTGLIRGEYTAIYGNRLGENVITNKGRLEGRVFLGDANDIYDGRGGTLTGDLYLGRGDDVAYGGDGSETVFVGLGEDFFDGGAGIDTLLLSYDWAGINDKHAVDLRITDKQVVGAGSQMTLRNVENLVGGDADDRFIGNDAANTLIGNGGNDTLDGYDGDDLLSGGAGNDLLVGGAGSDTAVFTGKFSDYTITVVAGAGIKITDNRTSGDGADYLGGVEFALFSDRIYTLPPVPPVGPVTPSKPAETPATPTTTDTPPVKTMAKNLTFKGGKKADTFVGGKGHDLLNGGLGNDRLTGDEGQDTFVFNSKLGSKNVDRITDFTHADDSIKLSKAIFSKLQKGILSKDAFWVGAKAHDKSDRIIFDDKTGALYYDADGTGKKYGAIKFAQLEAKTLLEANDFFIV
ncbi:calcium-binding protein [Microvirga flavescens]|uniref:calcium-binding protein n=1 Tax=Microvirga flavescens TaxID=2249811 RepID=UPI0013005F13|nr:calcium-binding protein [Microvirga flavescens]